MTQQPYPTSVYRYYDRAGVLLYVGVTSRGPSRNLEHVARAGWWPYVARQEVEHHPDRAAALIREKSLIREFRPPFNRQHNTEWAALREVYLAYAAADPLRAETFAEQYGRLKHKLRLVLVDRSDGHVGQVHLLAPPDTPLVNRQLKLSPADGWAFSGGRRVGQFHRVEAHAMSALIHGTVSPRVPEFLTATAHLKLIQSKPPPQVVRITGVSLDVES